MKNAWKRLLALILAMAMCLSLLSANVWAAELEPQAESETASVDVAEDGAESVQSDEDASGEESAQEEDNADGSAPEEEKTEEDSGEENTQEEDAAEESVPEEEPEEDSGEESTQEEDAAEESVPEEDSGEEQGSEEEVVEESTLEKEADESNNDDKLDIYDEDSGYLDPNEDNTNSDSSLEVQTSSITGDRDWRWPVPSSKNISSCFPNYCGHKSIHHAIDISADHNSPIYASYPGTVLYVNNDCNADYRKENGVCTCGKGEICLGKSVYILHNY